MKRILLCLSTLSLLSCSTTQTAQLKSDAIASAPIVEAAVSALGGQYGPAAAAVYGMAVQAWAGQPIAQGSGNAAVAAAVLPLLPAKTGSAVAALLTAAGNQLEANAK